MNVSSWNHESRPVKEGGDHASCWTENLRIMSTYAYCITPALDHPVFSVVLINILYSSTLSRVGGGGGGVLAVTGMLYGHAFQVLFFD